jgi:hypothetical protein
MKDGPMAGPHHSSTMNVILEIHLVLAFLAALVGLIFSWNTMGRRVVNAVVTLQVLVGLGVAGVLGAQHVTLPKEVWLHLGIGIVALGLYGAALGAGKRTGGSSRALVLSVIGLLLIFTNIWLGYTMTMRGGL